jgi:uncharacterized protein YcbX
MQTDADVQGAVVGLWRYPVKSMMGVELNTEVTDRGLIGDRHFAVVDPSTEKVAGAKNPRKWGNFFDFRAAYIEPPQPGSKLPSVRLTLPDRTAATSDQPDVAQVLSGALRRDVRLAETQGDDPSATSASCATSRGRPCGCCACRSRVTSARRFPWSRRRRSPYTRGTSSSFRLVSCVGSPI